MLAPPAKRVPHGSLHLSDRRPSRGRWCLSELPALSLHDVVGVTGVFTAKEPTYQVDAGVLHDALCAAARRTEEAELTDALSVRVTLFSMNCYYIR